MRSDGGWSAEPVWSKADEFVFMQSVACFLILESVKRVEKWRAR